MQQMTILSQKLYTTLEDSPTPRDASSIREYPFSDHAAVGVAALVGEIDYFSGWCMEKGC